MPFEYPADFLRECEAELGGEFAEFSRCLSAEPFASLRLNPRRAEARALLDGVVAERVAWEKNGFYTVKGFHPGDDPVHFAGGYYMQEASAMAPARVLNCKPGELVLDLCAAPGGKSGQIAADLNGRGALIANEPNEKRARMLAGNLERLGVTNVCVVCAPPEKLAEKWPETFDAVMVDAPCSGEGMFRRDAASRHEWSLSRVAGCAERQRGILESAFKMLKPSGRLVYSTCTFNRREDECNADWFAENHGVEEIDFSLPGAGDSQNGRMKLWLHRVKGEGQFMALFKKRGEAERRKTLLPASDKNAMSAMLLLEEALKTPVAGLLDFDAARLFGDSLHAVRREFPDMSGIKLFMRGVKLATVKNGYAVPEHALAMALDPRNIKKTEVARADALSFMRGNEIEGSVAGWTLVTYMGLPLGFGKCSQGRVRNHLPKGLRL